MKLNNVDFDTYFNNYPDENGYFGKYGGVYVDDKLKTAMAEMGLCDIEMRLPLCEMDDANKAKLVSIMKDYKLL